MNKAKVVTAAATVAASFGVVTQVHADDTDLATVSNNTEVSQNQSTEKVTKSDVDEAKANLDTANQAVSSQEQVVNDAATAADEAQSAYDQAQQSTRDAQNLVDQATPENIASAQDDVNSAQQQVEQANNTEKVAEDTAEQAQSAVNNQSEVVDTAQSAVSAAQSAVDAAQKDVNDKQAILDGTGQAEIITNRDKAQADVNAAQAQVSQKEADLTKAQEADANRQTAIDNAQQAVDEANQNVTSTKSDLDAKTAKANQTEQTLADAQSAYKVAEDDYKAINKITLTQAYVEALKKYNDYSLSSEERQQVLKTLVEESEALAKVNSYKSNPNDDNSTTYQINDLPEDVIKELSQFAADLVNQIRKAFGTPQVSVTSSSVKFADLVTDGYVSDSWNVSKAINEGQVGHDAKAVNNAARYFGLPTSPSDDEETGGQYYEDWASSAVYDGITFATLKQRVYEAVTDFMFNADEWRHARDIVGGGDINSHVYVAIDFSKPSSENGAFAGVHFISVAEDQLTTKNNNFDTNAIANPKSAENVTATYNTAKDSYNQATVANTAAQSAKSLAQAGYDNAIFQLSSASSALTQAQSVAVQTPSAKTNLASAQATLKQAKENLVSAQKAVDDLNADIKIKQANLESAKQVLATKEATLATKQATLVTEQNRLSALQNSLATAQANVNQAKENVLTSKDNLAKAQAYLISLQNAPELLSKAQHQEATAKSNLLNALDALEAELLKLKDLQIKQAAAQAVYDTTSKAYQAILDAQEKQHLQDEYNAIIAQGKIPVAIVDETGKIVSYQAEDPQATNQFSTNELTSFNVNKTVEGASVVKASVLPETGENSPVIAVFLGCLMTVWGLAGIRRKHN
ncbi:SEC10/PgrA surface exclusion domain-containing protein [Streptococcus agalactiae]|uniref:Transposon related peptidoglycan linked protein (LPXTG motif) n=1 Tax=Streptococcus agalactiae TaxID=1311 RepID=A0A8B4RBJ3_STRAG|nr:SEC10/PgrA surface exclusion domain-containing protein [Streptococcus agalactiae]SUN14064.1 transposon related peptidoglycan linked protein (LPXTG motif) [Streptococcus agalactiae]SUN23839.1 transposon related peptidoglycan linked protein (LPXTG motif) [Streptococcus agalactiae]